MVDEGAEDALPGLSARRVEYAAEGLEEAALARSPLAQFVAWFREAEAALVEPNAMILATADEDGPTARTVLLKGVGAEGFTFFTNHGSLKARQIDASRGVALLFPWHDMQRQVRVRGVARRVPAEESDAYFASRGRESQLGAWASRQSEPAESRAQMDGELDAIRARFAGRDVPRPDFWGGYRVQPLEVEFWAGRGGRFHDRLVFTSTVNGPAALDQGESWSLGRRYP